MRDIVIPILAVIYLLLWDRFLKNYSLIDMKTFDWIWLFGHALAMLVGVTYLVIKYW